MECPTCNSNVVFCRTQAQLALDSGMLGAAIVPVLRNYGNHCHQSTVNAPFVTLIFGLHMSRFFPKTDIEQLVKKTEKRTALKGSTLH